LGGKQDLPVMVQSCE